MKSVVCPECGVRGGREFTVIEFLGPKGGKKRVYNAYCTICGYKAPMNGATKDLADTAFVNRMEITEEER